MIRRFLVLAVIPALLASSACPALAETQNNKQQLRVMGLYQRGNQLLSARRYAEAERSFLDALKLAPNIAPIHHGLGLVYMQTQDYELAVIHLEEALRLEPDTVKTLFTLAKAYASVGESKRAWEAYGKVIQLDPHHEGAHQDLAGIYYREKNWDKALEYLKRARDINPSSSHTLMLIGVTGLHAGQVDIALEAVTDLKRIGEPAKARRLEYLVYSSKEKQGV
ncbi:MAG: tetratricopeptide repeat protein [Candidatus Omnitrophica bacterium]|nr:tetratricopeptide repeat protein [Candidatus Omnitrophota bacterium]